VGDLAHALALNPMTVSKAYGLLELDPDTVLTLFATILKEKK
jgi:DNA-binding transcriptional regulator YhcF (GntR family)